MYLSEQIVAFLIDEKVIVDENREIYEYGFELLLADMINLLIILLIGGMSHQIWPTVIYLLIFVCLRSVCGGYHAKTHLRCHMGTIGVYAIFLILLNMRVLKSNPILLLCGDFVAAIPIILFAPIQHSNKPLDDKVRRRNHIIAILMLLLLLLLAMILGYYGRQESTIISLSLWIVSACMLPAINVDIQHYNKEDI